ncbi:MAG: hypothetical protein ABW189_05280 [Rickettsiales bacterium]
MTDAPNDGKYIVEFVRLGEYVKVTAVDPVSLREASVVMAVRGLTRSYMERTAIRKLESMLSSSGG